jgi:broad specificity phosphatase PhoE
MLANAGVTRLVASQYRRTHETLAPLAERLSLPIDVKRADATSELVAELRSAPPGAVVVVATHSDVLPRIVRELGGPKLKGVEGDALADDDFARVVVLTFACTPTRESPSPFTMELSSGPFE